MQAKELKCKIVGVGAWGSYFENWQGLQALLNGAALPETKLKGPKPGIIPANERRRAPLPVRLAVESSWQATKEAGVEPNTLTCVFVSGLGDTDLTDYMCKTLASEHKELSPTKFHNSVHNAPAGYWTISTGTMCAANSVAGYEASVSLTLLEAMIQCETEHSPMLLTFYDAPVADILTPVLANQETFAFSLVVFPHDANVQGQLVTARVKQDEQATWPALRSNSDYIGQLYAKNPAAKVLCLAELLKHPEGQIVMPLSSGTALTISCEE
ncbi:beta-ketoacyl synthase chain length factor [Salinimonas sediminis]|uniref:Beta-ketoacyl synthase-like N-terminal domain-containing protein n=1 Tax=Salinimonas sediminis TaxID=2303538 RepID=A0A346NQ30_9ALTE|nr:beta-ketoacyl synthase chain length factor [Salinimonas sediminis]AXR07637.1 hypothetical protein D0Y50_15475 [Salinimonas sediminis]